MPAEDGPRLGVQRAGRRCECFGQRVPAVPAVDFAGPGRQPRRLLWLGGLVAVGAVGVLEWRVVAALGVGSYVAEQFAKSDIRQDLQHPPSPSPQERRSSTGFRVLGAVLQSLVEPARRLGAPSLPQRILDVVVPDRVGGRRAWVRDGRAAIEVRGVNLPGSAEYVDLVEAALEGQRG